MSLRIFVPERAATLLCAAAIVGCSDLTRITDTQVNPPPEFDTPSGALARRAGAISEIANDFSAQVFATGLLTDELTSALPFNNGQSYIDARQITATNNSVYPWGGLSKARLEALRAIATLVRYNPVPRSRIGELYALMGFVETAFAENMCNGIPMGTLSGGRPASAGMYARSALLRLAISHFDSAAANATDSTGASDVTIAALAAVGQARALVDSGDFANAATAVASIPTGFAYTLPYDGVLQTNMVAQNALSGQIYVSDHEGINGLNYVSAADPRVVIANNGTAYDGHAEYMTPLDLSLSGATPLATGVEAQLIVAEAFLRAGNVPQWAATLNALRQTAIVPAIDTLPSDSATAASAVDQVTVMFRERAFWLFLTGHRQGDMRRLSRQYGRPIEAVFPTGPYAGGGSYSTDVTFVPPGNEGAYTGCMDRKP